MGRTRFSDLSRIFLSRHNNALIDGACIIICVNDVDIQDKSAKILEYSIGFVNIHIAQQW